MSSQLSIPLMTSSSDQFWLKIIFSDIRIAILLFLCYSCLKTFSHSFTLRYVKPTLDGVLFRCSRKMDSVFLIQSVNLYLFFDNWECEYWSYFWTVFINSCYFLVEFCSYHQVASSLPFAYTKYWSVLVV